MKVLKNLFGRNEKISANDIAIKNANNKAVTLDNYLQKSFCKMKTNFDYREIRDPITVYGWENVMSYGDYTADSTTGRLIIKNTRLVQLHGLISGSSSALAKFLLYDENNNLIDGSVEGRILYQPAGNGYWQIPLSPRIFELDPNKTYYVTLEVGVYNADRFYMNNGFGTNGTWISAEKIM